MILTKVSQNFTLPFEAYNYQREVVNELGDAGGIGLYMDVGTGKTFVSTAIALYKGLLDEVDHVIVLMPPILLISWSEWLSQIPDITHCIYRGTPRQRQQLSLDNDFTLMSMNIFKNDFDRLMKFYGNRRVYVILDEATCIRNVTTQNFKKFRRFISTKDKQFALLTGTAISSPMHCYGYIKLIAPDIYRSKRFFEQTHVQERDFFGQVTKWKNLDLLSQNFMVNAVRILADDVLDLPDAVYDVAYYELTPQHKALYKKLAEEKILFLPDGGKIDATQATALYNDMQRIILYPERYAGKPIKPAGYDVIDNMLEELDGDKLIIFNNYRDSNRAVTEYLNKKWEGKDEYAVACFGEVSTKQKEANIKAFLDDPNCKVIVAAPTSMGVGLNLQKACRCVLFMELPITPAYFEQAVGRVLRVGQNRHVLIRIAVAKGTIQYSLQKSLAGKDDLIQQVSKNRRPLRPILFGE